ncbi:SMP-30/gluconolactonase/LRE family protein [Methylobacterium sp. PvR107]|uniref:SMP-30/gluconolactonase/LRE family protein n=1 Tax=Methylobacterium sp. PvR107 TaxID=2806597 RepID=UPI001B44103F|nr:SMP-30/gluconolactonase/LRE family protein [Methylobacterium sp. PvR107]MBP1183963.1 sugar lactone lactonase YvrE [Methylobacterium sp. PvR107]
MAADQTLGERRAVVEAEPGVPDGLCVDRGGWIWTRSGAGIQVFSVDGHRLGLIPVCSNCCFGPGEARRFITSKAHLYAIDLAAGPS